MYHIFKRIQWFSSGVILTVTAGSVYVYTLSLFSKIKFQWWVWTAELSDLLKWNF